MPKINKGFNQAEYVAGYHKEHYKKKTAAFTKEEAEKMEKAAKKAGMTCSAYIKMAVKEKMERDGM